MTPSPLDRPVATCVPELLEKAIARTRTHNTPSWDQFRRGSTAARVPDAATCGADVTARTATAPPPAAAAVCSQSVAGWDPSLSPSTGPAARTTAADASSTTHQVAGRERDHHYRQIAAGIKQRRQMAAAAMPAVVAVLATAALALLAHGAAAARSSCYADNTTPYLLLGAKTAYEFVYGRPTPQQITIPYCEPQQIWILSRHGTRYPEADDYGELSALTSLRDQIIRNHEVNHEGDLCDKDLDNLRNWTLKFTPDLGEILTKQGEDDMRLMAQRFKNRYPSLFSEGYRQDLYEFRYTNTQRTKASAEKFAEGLFGSSQGVYFPTPLDNDTLLKPYDSCKTWKTMVDDNPDAKKEQTLFEEGPWMKEVVANVSKRLGFRYQLKYDNISAIYDMCRYDKAWNLVAVSPWCAAFSDTELKVMEYKDDLKYYYKSGYGHDINVELGCTTLKDLMDHFQNLESSKTSAKGVFYFSHSSMLHMTQSRMGIAKDSEPLTHNSYNTAQKRKWRSSKIGSFATNIAAVFLKCTEGDAYRVMFYVAENVADIPGCQVGLCSWDTVKAKYADIAAKCNLDFCNMNKSGATGIHRLTWFYALLNALIVMFLLKWH